MRTVGMLALGGAALFMVTLGETPDGAVARGGDPCPASMIGVWGGTLDAKAALTVRIELVETSPGRFTARLTRGGREERVAVWNDKSQLRLESARLPLSMQLEPSADRETLAGFVYFGSWAIHVVLHRAQHAERPSWETAWSPLGVSQDSVPLDLYVVDNGGITAGFLFFRDQRFPLPWTYGLECAGDTVTFSERNLGLDFAGTVNDSLTTLAGALVQGTTPVRFRKLPAADLRAGYWSNEGIRARPIDDEYDLEHAPPQTGDGWRTATPASEGIDIAPLREMVRAIVTQDLTLTHGLLVARHDRLVFEQYFYGFDADTWHDMRSASKTFAATLIGLAIDQGRIDGVDARVLDFFPRYRALANWDDRKAQITVRHLLTMSSGLDADDGNQASVASENAYQSQTAQPDWSRFVLDAPMIADPGSRTLYGGANPLLLGGVLQAVTVRPVEWLVAHDLFGPLGIERYKFMVDPSGLLYMGGGVHMRPRDMAKFGQLHLDRGTWNGNRIVPEAWVRESMGNYTRLENLWDNEYGYLWWHRDYKVGDRTVHSIEARGAGGQYIFVVPELDLVAVITSGNYTNGRFRQPEEIMERFIVPASLGSAGH